MLALNINNPIVEEFYIQECKNDKNTFVDNIVDYIENYNIKQSVKKGFEEVKLQEKGNINETNLDNLIDELRNNTIN